MRGQLAEQDLAQVKVGDAASVHLTGLPEAFEGRVALLGAIIDPQTRLGEIRITLKPDPALRPGAFARGTVAVNEALRPVVPQTAVLTDTGGSYVYLVNAQSHAERRGVHVADTSHPGALHAAPLRPALGIPERSEEHTAELQSRLQLACRLLVSHKEATGIVSRALH